MKLLYITNGINGAGGLERVLSVKASLLADSYGYEVTILGLNKGNDNPFYDFSSKINLVSIRVEGNFLQYIHQYRKGILKTIRDIQPDIIAVCDDGLKGFLVPQFIKTKAQIIYERHVSKCIEKRNGAGWGRKMIVKAKWFLMELLAKKFAKFVVLTDGNRNEWSTLKNVVVISNPLSFHLESAAPLTDRTVICVGKISYQKGQDLLLKSWQIVHRKHPNWSLELYGKEQQDFFDVRSYSDFNVHFYLPEKHIREKYLKSAINVMSSRFEGFGMVLIEAMACGVPCVSFDCPSGPADIIRDGEDGFLVEPQNTEALAEKVMMLIEDEKLRQKMGEAAKKNVKRFEAKHVVKQWDQLFKGLIT